MKKNIYRKYFEDELMDLIVAADFSEASCPLRGCWVEPGESIPTDEDERWFSSPYQVASARHRPSLALSLVGAWSG